MRQGADVIKQQVQNEQLAMEVNDLKNQLKAYEEIKNQYMKDQASQSEKNEYNELVDKLSLLKEENVSENDRLKKALVANESKIDSLNKYQQMVRNMLNANKLAKVKINTREVVIEEKSQVIVEKEAQVDELEGEVQKNKKLIALGENQIQQAKVQLNERLKQLKNAFKSNKITRAILEKKMAQASLENQTKVKSLLQEKQQYQQELAGVTSRLQIVASDLDETKNNLEKKNSELANTKTVLDKKTGELVTTRSILEQKASELAATKGVLDKKTGELITTKSILDKKANELDQTKGILDKKAGELLAAQGDLDRKAGELAATKGVLSKKAGELEATKGILDKKTGELMAARGNLEQTAGELNATKSLLNQKAGEAESLQNKLAQSARDTQSKIAGLQNSFAEQQGREKAAFLGELNKLKLGAAERARREEEFRNAALQKERNLSDQMSGLQGQLAKAKAEIEARQSVAKDIRSQFAKAGIKAEVNSETGEVLLDFGESYFDSGSAQLKAEMKSVIEKAIPVYAKSLLGNAKIAEKVSGVEIIGFASPTYKGRFVDPKSSKKEDQDALKYNMDLSYSRAKSIFNYMVDNQDGQTKDQRELMSLMKVSGRSFLEVAKIDKNVAPQDFCKVNDCKKAQRVVIRFNMDQSKK
jgi:chromosome segregation ATPase